MDSLEEVIEEKGENGNDKRLGSVIDGTRDYVVTWIEINLAD